MQHLPNMTRQLLIATVSIVLLAWTGMTACQPHHEKTIQAEVSIVDPEPEPKDFEKLLETMEILRSEQYEERTAQHFFGTLVKERTISAPPYTLEVGLYEIPGFELYDGICDGVSIYKNGQEFAQLELGFQRTTASFEAITKDLGDYFIGKVEAENAGGRLSVNSLYVMDGFAINIITLKDNQKAGSIDISQDDVFFISITAKKYYNDISSSGFGYIMK